MKIKTSDFKKALDTVKPALATKDIIEQSTSFAFYEETVFAYNDEICIISPLKGFEFEGVIKAEELYKFLGKVKNDEFDVLLQDDEIVMKAGRSKVGFAFSQEILLPINEEIAEKGKWHNLPEEFIKACKFAAASTSTDMSDQKLTCVHINNEVIEATNNFKMVMWALESPVPVTPTLIPAQSIKQVIKLNPTQVSQGNGWVHFKNKDSVLISCRVLDEAFVDCASVIARIKKTKKITFPKDLVPVLEKAEIFAHEQGGTTEMVELEFKNNRVTIKSENMTSWFKEAIKYDGDDEFVFSIAPYLLKDILKETNTCSMNKNTLKFSGENWVYVTSLSTYVG